MRYRLLQHAATATLACAVVAACVPPPAPTPAPAPAPTPAPVPTPAPAPPPFAGNWADAPLTPGDWTYRAGPGDTTIALFGDAPDRPKFSLGCYQPGQVITFRRYEPATVPAPLRVLTEMREGSLVTRPAQTDGSLIAELPSRDPLLDAMAFSKGRFAIETPGLPTLYIPSWPEVTRVIEDCR